MILNSPYISGSLTVTGNTTIQGQLTVTGSLSGTASLASNALLLQGTGSNGFATTASINEVSAIQQSISASLLQVSASYIALSGSYNTFSGSASTRITENSSSIQQVSSSQQQISASLLQVSASYISLSGSYNTYSSSVSTRTTQIENVYATTGSNSFRATQSITGSLTVTGQIIAQTINVQQVTSSIIYSSGSNVFGCDLNSRQTFTGSVLITGSLTIAGASSATSYSGTTIYGSTAVCSPVGKFTSCIDAGTGTFSGTLTDKATNISADGAGVVLQGYVDNVLRIAVRGSGYNDGARGGLIALTGDFSSTINGTTIYGSTAVCSPVGKFTTCLDLGGALTGTSATFANRVCTAGLTVTDDIYFGIGAGAYEQMTLCYSGYNSASPITTLMPKTAPGSGAITTMLLLKSNGLGGGAGCNHMGLNVQSDTYLATCNGNVGIGTCTPSAKLHINGSTGASTYKGFAYTYAGSETLTNEVLFQAVVGGYSSNLPIFLFKDERSDQGTTQRIFEIQGGRSGVGTILTTLANGNVGIGCTTPDYKLDISGSLRTTAGTYLGTSSSNVIIGGTTSDLTNQFKFITIGNTAFQYGASTGTYLRIEPGAADTEVALKADARSGGYPPMTFYTTATERMRITSAGPVDIGGWGTGTDISLRIKGNSNGQVGFFNHDGQLYMPYLDTSTGTDLVLTSGGYINKKSSSIRYKKNVQPIDIGLNFILSLNPVSYNLKDNNAPQVGFIAEDFPEDRLVSLSMIDIQDETKGYQKESVNYAQIVAPLVKAIQELKAEFDTYKETHP